MKQFFKSTFGKTTLFICCVLSTVLLVASIITVFFFVDYDIYSKTEEQIYQTLAEPIVQQDTERVLVDFLVDDYLDEYDDKGNLIYEITSDQGSKLAQSISAEKINQWQYSFFYERGFYPLSIAFNEKENLTEETSVVVNASINDVFVVNDKYQILSIIVALIYSLKYSIYFLAFILVIVDIFCFVGLLSNAGKSDEREGIQLSALHKLPLDVLLLGYGFLCLIVVSGFQAFYWNMVGCLLYILCAGVVLFSFLLGIILSISVRVKTGTLIQNNVVYYLWVLIKKMIIFLGMSAIEMIRAIPLVWKGLFLVGAWIIVNFLFHYSWRFEALQAVVAIIATIILAMNLRRLQIAGQKLAKGDLDNKLDTKGLLPGFKSHGENLNKISEGMSIAVEERIKSERMKTELITNVSHDIKTPLTSIINYATLIGHQKTDNEKITEYSEVLVRQSVRLKRLIEDLVEASKASTGNLEVCLTPCDANVFLEQAAGEYLEKLKMKRLTLITKTSDQEVRVLADGHRMWRIFDNLMNNIFKYAQSDTRVYLSIEKSDNQAVIIFKNTSRDQLDMSEEELMERFTRGDHSRNTEGNGLGLNIARSLAELQQGTLDLEIDGDLFKAILKFPIIAD